MTTLGQRTNYHGKIGALTFLGGALAMHGATAARAIGEGATEGLCKWMVQALGPEAAYQILQQSADGVANELIRSERQQPQS